MLCNLRTKYFARVVVALALASSLTGCAWTWAFHRQGATSNCRTELLSMDAVPGDFVLRERQRILSRDRKIMLELVAEKHGSTLVLVGLHRMGQKAFKIVQQGERVSVQTYWGRPAVRPINVLRDFHRVHFLSLARLDALHDTKKNETRPTDGERSAAYGEERIREIWRDGRLAQRVFEQGSDPAQAIELTFRTDNQVRIENRRCGYLVEILQSK